MFLYRHNGSALKSDILKSDLVRMMDEFFVPVFSQKEDIQSKINEGYFEKERCSCAI